MKHSPHELEALTGAVSPEHIARQGNYETIVTKLKEHNYLNSKVEEIKHEFGERISEPWMTEEDWEMLATLGVFDRVTLLHSIGVYEIAKRKLQETLVDKNNNPINLAAIIESEGVNLPAFFRACLFHDIGKVEVPYEILMNSLTETEWEEYLYTAINSADREKILHQLNLDQNTTHTKETVRTALKENWLRPISILPARLVLTEAELQTIYNRGYTGDETLAEIIASHETHSAVILKNQGYHTEAELAGHHHNRHREPLQYPQSTKLLQIGTIALGENAIGLLHAADVEEALTSTHRQYKKPLSLLHSLDILVDHARHQELDTTLAYIWIRSELQSLSNSEKDELGLIDEFAGASADDPEIRQEFAHLTAINEFLAAVENRLN